MATIMILKSGKYVTPIMSYNNLKIVTIHILYLRKMHFNITNKEHLNNIGYYKVFYKLKTTQHTR